jgi:hypothetical protein
MTNGNTDAQLDLIIGVYSLSFLEQHHSECIDGKREALDIIANDAKLQFEFIAYLFRQLQLVIFNDNEREIVKELFLSKNN